MSFFHVFPLPSFNVADGSKGPLQLTLYLASEFPPKVMMLDDAILNLDVDPVIMIPDFPF